MWSGWKVAWKLHIFLWRNSHQDSSLSLISSVFPRVPLVSYWSLCIQGIRRATPETLTIHSFFYAFIQHLWLCIKNYALYWRFWNEKLSLFQMLSVSKMKKKTPHHSPCYEFSTILAIINWDLHFNPFASMLSNMPSSKRIVNSGCFYMQNTHFKEQNFVLIFCLANFLEVVHFNADAFFTFLSYMSDMFMCISSRALLSLRKQNLSN